MEAYNSQVYILGNSDPLYGGNLNLFFDNIGNSAFHFLHVL